MAGVELGGAGPQLGGGAVAAVDLVGEHERQEVGVGQGLGAGQREPLGQGVEAAAELDPPQQRLQFGVDAGRRCGVRCGRLTG